MAQHAGSARNLYRIRLSTGYLGRGSLIVQSASDAALVANDAWAQEVARLRGGRVESVPMLDVEVR